MGCERSGMTIINHLFPANDFNIKKYKVSGFDPRTSQILFLTNYAYPSFIVKGQ